MSNFRPLVDIEPNGIIHVYIDVDATAAQSMTPEQLSYHCGHSRRMSLTKRGELSIDGRPTELQYLPDLIQNEMNKVTRLMAAVLFISPLANGNKVTAPQTNVTPK